MNAYRNGWTGAALCCLAMLWAPLAAADEAQSARADKVFAAWDKPESPGLSIAVMRDGKVVHSRGYGLANLEYGVRNTPATVFHAASVSKQFTAFAVHLLAQDGKLSLDDEVRKHLPELQVQGPPITIRHLLHHTSGLRDQWSLLQLAGLRMDDGITEGDILGLLWQQRQLNFAPGEDELYSNSGYTLLALIVKRVSGQSLAAFAQQRIFNPLGMENTHFHENYGELVKGRAYSYVRGREGWRYTALSFSNVGATSLFTTVEDLARWDANFDDARVGGPALVAAMQVPGRLNSGREITYASGLGIRSHRGLAAVEHAGIDAGYRAHILRFPKQRLSVLMLGNASDLATGELARRVADIYLEGTAGLDGPRAFPAEVELEAREFAPYLGDFQLRPGVVLNFAVEGNRLMVQPTGQAKFPMFAAADNRFFAKAFEAEVTFKKPTGNEPVSAAIWKERGRDLPLARITREAPSLEALQSCAGDFYSDELRTLYGVQLREGKLVVRYPRGERELKPVTRDVYAAGAPIGTVSFQRNDSGCDAFTLTTGRVRNLRFVRLKLPVTQ
jgi:CubicO group peptidase (beta-lactamase class C family)